MEPLNPGFSPLSGERRIGVRHTINVEIEWSVVRKKSRFGRAPAPVPGAFVDLSATGAAIKSPRDDAFGLGMIVRISLDGTSGLAQIRSVRMTDEGGICVYGVQFIDTGLLPAVSARLDMYSMVEQSGAGQFDYRAW